MLHLASKNFDVMDDDDDDSIRSISGADICVYGVDG